MQLQRVDGALAFGGLFSWMAPLAGQTPGRGSVRTSAASSPSSDGWKKWTAPRTPWSHPDLQGLWNNGTGTPLGRPPYLADREFLTDEEWAARAKSEAARAAEDRSLQERCLLYHGMPPFSTWYKNNCLIVRSRDFVAIRYEMLAETPLILTGRASAAWPLRPAVERQRPRALGGRYPRRRDDRLQSKRHSAYQSTTRRCASWSGSRVWRTMRSTAGSACTIRRCTRDHGRSSGL